MIIEETHLKGCFVISSKVFNDERGLFLESFNQKLFEEKTSIYANFVQDNQSISKKGVVRGLHFQTGAFAQAKLVRVVKGKVLDVCVDLREQSGTFGKYFSVILDDKENKQIYIPRGFAHGFLALEDNTIFNYKCDNYYSQNHESGIVFNDEALGIDWNFPLEKMILSQKDRKLSTFESLYR